MKFLLLALSLLVAGCCGASSPPKNPSPFTGLTLDSSYTNGLSSSDRRVYYGMDEGIQYLPVDVLMALNRPTLDGIGLYKERIFTHPERLGLYPNLLSPGSPPLGITSSDDPRYVPMAGLNCSTCHTTAIRTQGKLLLIDGGSSLFAIDHFVQEMILSVIGTMACPEEFAAFYSRYRALVAARQGRFGASLDEKDEDLDGFLASSTYDKVREVLTLRDDPMEGLQDFERTMTLRMPSLMAAAPSTTLTSHPYPTYSELNSGVKMFVYMARRFAHFYAQTKYASNPPGSTVSDNGLGRSNPWAVVKNMLSANFDHRSQEDWPKELGGPINTPVIWDFESQRWVFWTGVTNSMLERNLAQGIALLTDFNWDSYETTVSIKKLEAVSKFARKATPPKWPEAYFGVIDKAKAEAGKKLFSKQCLGCHDPSGNSRGPGEGLLNYRDVGTDPEYYKGQAAVFDEKSLFRDALRPFLAVVKERAVTREGVEDLRPYEVGRTPVSWKGPTGVNRIIARPLYGIWASPPFLHNGSVMSIRELLKPAEKRVKSFAVGSLDYDPVNLGFKNELPYYGTTFKVECDKCTGNSNKGHEIGVDLLESDKDNLIEFLKTYDVTTTFL